MYLKYVFMYIFKIIYCLYIQVKEVNRNCSVAKAERSSFKPAYSYVNMFCNFIKTNKSELCRKKGATCILK